MFDCLGSLLRTDEIVSFIDNLLGYLIDLLRTCPWEMLFYN
jgi:hypothetical protein